MDDVKLITAPNGIAASGLPDDVGSAGHTISAVNSQQSVAEVVDQIEKGWQEAREASRRILESEDQMPTKQRTNTWTNP